MSNMINFPLENAKHTVISARIALNAAGIKDYGSHNSLSSNSNTVKDSVPDIKTGFSTGTDLPLAWQ